ncbi:ECF RNA polymerase sigma factor SigL [Bremerella volcania]|uniref:ECF RNA polymerase sigma factor SigL n=1 Tax=Bremerella volcania TaxID=2527984 RepID=A0A518C9E2_9BACT|nr:sigma-70 family RNA polymerase sigma factor [Bremerella volcania]QDU75846.1 ECF RNA polymerase sigma factor SigL [Bremerella volcania]
MTSTEFIQLLTSSQCRIYAYILSLTFDPDQAEDVLQQTNALLWEKADQFQPDTNFIAWSFRIAYFQVLAHRKTLQRERLIFDDEALQRIAETSKDCDDTFEARQRLLRECLEKLTDRHREFIRRRYQLGATLEKIALDTGTSVNAVKQLLFRARNALYRCVHALPDSEAAI